MKADETSTLLRWLPVTRELVDRAAEQVTALPTPCTSPARKKPA